MAFQFNCSFTLLLCYFRPFFFSNLFDKDELGMPLIEAVKDFVIYIKQKFQGQVAGILCAGGGIRGCDIAMHDKIWQVMIRMKLWVYAYHAKPQDHIDTHTA